MNFLGKFILAAALGLSMISCTCSYASSGYVYDMNEARNVLENPKAYPETRDFDTRKIDMLKNFNSDTLFLFSVITKNVTNAIDYKIMTYEDENVKVSCFPRIGWEYFYGSDEAIKVVNVKLSGGNVTQSYEAIIDGVELCIINKTNTVMEVDFSKSYIAINNKVTPLYDKKQEDLYKHMLIPRKIAPNDSWKECFRLKGPLINNNGQKFSANTELLGQHTIVINNKEVTFPLSAVVNSLKLGFKQNS